MIVNKFKSNNLFIVLLIPIMAILLWAKMFTVSELKPINSDSFQMPLYQLVYNYIHIRDMPRISRIVALFLFIIQAFLIVRLNIKHGIIKQKNYLPGFIFIILAGSFIPLHRLHPIYFANIFLIMALDSILSSYKKNNAISNFFDASLLISIGSLFYVNMIIYTLFVWVGIFIFRSFKWREWFVSVIGLLLPYFLVVIYYHLFTTEENFETLIMTTGFNMLFQDFNELIINPHIIVYAFILILSIDLTIHNARIHKFRKIKSRNALILLLWISIISVIVVLLSLVERETINIYFNLGGAVRFIPVIFPKTSMELLLIISVPFSIVFSSYLHNFKSQWISDLILCSIIGFVIYGIIATPI